MQWGKPNGGRTMVCPGQEDIRGLDVSHYQCLGSKMVFESYVSSPCQSRSKRMCGLGPDWQAEV